MIWIAAIFAVMSGWLAHAAVWAYFSGGTSTFSPRFYLIFSALAALQAVWIGGLL